MTAKTAIIFDLDGTLADTAPDLLAALNHSLEGHGFPVFNLSEIGHLVGHGSISMIRKAFELHGQHLEDNILADLHRRFLAYYEENMAVHTRLYTGALELIDALDANGHPLFVCTNKYEAMAKKLLGELSIGERFKAVTGGDTFAFRKPDGRHLTQTLVMGGHGPANAIMIGDTITDADAARNAGLHLVLVDFGYSETPVSGLKPDAVISRFSDGAAAIAMLAR
jgi:phosphoglycolate phosphatase